MRVVDKPNMHPYSCIQCGVTAGRKWFVDLGINLGPAFNPLYDGNVFLCDECWEGLSIQVAKEVQKFLQPVSLADNYVEPTYNNEEPLIERGPINGHSETESTDDRTHEHNDPEPIPSDNATATDAPSEGATGTVDEFNLFFNTG